MSESGRSRDEIRARMAQSRAEIRRLLDPAQPSTDEGSTVAANAGVFPRSRTMRLLLSSRGIGTVGAIAGSLLMARPALAIRLLRLIPLGAIGRILLVKAISALRSDRG